MILRVGTRGSPLALIQAEMVKSALLKAHGWGPDRVEIVPISTKGDRDRVAPLTSMGGKAVWTKELDRALLAEETHISVHSMKDVESIRPEGLGIAAMLEREDVRDMLVGADSLDALPEAAVVGTASPRRAAQVKAHRADLQTTLLRGNVATRLDAVGKDGLDATLLAAAGLNRLGFADRGTPVATDIMLPAPGQGAVGIDARSDDAATREALAAISHVDTFEAVTLERAFTAALGGDCHSPVAAHATRQDDGRYHLRCALYSEGGADNIARDAMITAGDVETAAALGRDMLAAAPPSIQRLFEQ